MSSGARASTRRRIWLPVFWIVVAVLTAFCAFVLPFFFPRDQPVLSASYTAGDNNRVAAIAVAAVLCAVLLACWWWRIGAGRRPSSDAQTALDATVAHKLERDQRLSRRWLLAAIVAAVLFTGALGWLVTRAHIFWGDEGYFLNRLRAGLVFHRPLYSGFEFSYGPILYWWPAAFVLALGALGVSMPAAYMASLAAIQALGLALLFYVVQALPIRRWLKASLFALLSFGFLTPLLGINYSAFRFVLPFAGVVWLSRQRRIAAAVIVAVAAEAIELASSPEMGMAFGAAVVVYGVYRAIVSRPAWIWVSAAAGVTALVGRGSLITMARFAKGEFNLIVEPLPHMIVFLISAVALAPLAVAVAVRNERRNAGMLLAMFVASIGLLPVVMGRCDPIHVLFNGLGFYLLSFVAIDRAPRRWRNLWVAAVTAVVLLTQLVNFATYRVPFRTVLRRTPGDASDGIDMAQLEAAIGNGTVAVPVYAPQTVVNDLTGSGQYRPNYFSGLGWDRAAEQRTVADMRQTQFALLPTQPVYFTEAIDNTRIKRILRLGYVYRQRREPFVVGYGIEAELKQHWHPVGQFGSFTLYRKIS
jgi:hypothetical protein